MFEVADNLREDLVLVIGRPEIDRWDVISLQRAQD